MIQDKTIDETLVELARTMKALQALRAKRKEPGEPVTYGYGEHAMRYPSQVAVRAAAKRASLDLTRKLADLRASK